jgi:hypothetical protein
MTFTPPSGLDYLEKVEVMSSGSSNQVLLNGVEVIASTYSINEYHTIATGSGTINSIQLVNANNSSPGFASIRVDGKELIDANIQDTVVDSPVKNYAVLEGGSDVTLGNGNLEVTTTTSGSQRIAFTTFPTPVNGVYYAEYYAKTADAFAGFSPLQTQADQLGSGDNQVAYSSDNGQLLVQGPGYVETGWETWGTGDIIGLACDATGLYFWKNGEYQGSYSVTSTSGWYFGAGNNNQSYAFNFGQQPFVYGDHDLAAGTVVFPPSIVDTSQVWSDYFSGTTLTNPQNAFDGTALEATVATGAVDILWTVPGGLDYTTSVEVAGAGNPSLCKWSLNGEAVVDAVNNSSTFVSLATGPGTLNTIRGTASSGGFNWAQIRVDGIVLINNDPALNQSQVWSNYVSSTSTIVDPAINMFDGNVDTYTETEPSGTVTFLAPSQQTGNLRIKIKCGSRNSVPSGDFDLKLEGVSVFDDSTFPNNSNAWVDFGTQTWTTLTFGSDAGGDWIAVAAVEVDGKILVDGQGYPGGTYQTLYEELEGYQVAGGYFYDETNQRAVRGSDLRKRFGLTSADPRLGIYELTEVPGHSVIGYEKVGNKYKPLRDFTPEVRSAQAETEVAEAQAAQYLGYLRSAACAWVVAKAYVAGDIIEFNGELYRALQDDTATADNDPGDLTAHWEALGITA